jgi:hypothetical protein
MEKFSVLFKIFSCVFLCTVLLVETSSWFCWGCDRNSAHWLEYDIHLQPLLEADKVS